LLQASPLAATPLATTAGIVGMMSLTMGADAPNEGAVG